MQEDFLKKAQENEQTLKRRQQSMREELRTEASGGQPDAPLQVQPATRRKKKWPGLVCCLLVLAVLAVGAWLYGGDVYTLCRFGIRTVHSGIDADHDFLDDYTDMVRSARSYIETQPEYISAYFAGGYPPEGQGVCTDVIWRAMDGAGYDFKAMIDADIQENASLYPLTNGLPDPNIDFRRVVNLEVYFGRHFISLTTDVSEIDQWQPGDIVVYDGHVAMVSDRRNGEGRPYIIHHAGYGPFEEDKLDYKPIRGHYRLPG